jgi:hypothetical protein
LRPSSSRRRAAPTLSAAIDELVPAVKEHSGISLGFSKEALGFLYAKARDQGVLNEPIDAHLSKVNGHRHLFPIKTVSSGYGGWSKTTYPDKVGNVLDSMAEKHPDLKDATLRRRFDRR